MSARKIPYVFSVRFPNDLDVIEGFTLKGTPARALQAHYIKTAQKNIQPGFISY
jgi:hypothetical protein